MVDDAVSYHQPQFNNLQHAFRVSIVLINSMTLPGMIFPDRQIILGFVLILGELSQDVWPFGLFVIFLIVEVRIVKMCVLREK